MPKPFVFISSVVRGMETTRSLIRKLIKEDLGYDVVLSDYEGSKPRTPISQCKKWSRECDIYIGILGKRYGAKVPNQGISVTEFEFNEARKASPEKVLIYVSDEEKEPSQQKFIERIQDFTKGYFRRKPYMQDNEIVEGIREDLAEFVKERFNVIKQKNIKIKPKLTPSKVEYVTASLSPRAEWMHQDIKEVITELGLKLYQLELPNEMASAIININRRSILCSFWIVPDNISRDYLRSYTIRFQLLISGEKKYGEIPSRFTLFLVHGNASCRSILSHFKLTGSRTCFSVQPGLYCGPGLDRGNETSLFYENMLFLPNITNKEVMLSKLVDAFEWLKKEFDRTNFKCNMGR